MADARDTGQLQAERDLYRRLLDVGAHDVPAAFLDDALALVVDITGAKQGYLELREGKTTVLSTSQGLTEKDVDGIRAAISEGILAQALTTGKTISTASALEDPRFSARESVQLGRIQAVLCAPMGESKPVGAIYLQGRTPTGPFPEADRALLELCARQLAPMAERLLRQHRPEMADHTVELRKKLKVEGLAGSSRAMADTLQQLLVAAGVDITVLITGESGTGKTEVARALHASSRRSHGPFVEINCAAIPETLFEAELFGAEKGAHSTATRRMPGKIASAEHGTLFLDEVGELPLSVQAKLLQFLQSRTYFALGSTQGHTADVRIVAATNVDLEQAVAEKRFREDLFYRINVLTIPVPSLRQRVDDIPVLAAHIMAQVATQFGRPLELTQAARFALMHAAWPGNVRQLASTLQRAAAVAVSQDSAVVDVHHIHPDAAPQEDSLDYAQALRTFQRAFLTRALEACGGNVSETARRTGLARSHLHELLRAHGLGRPRAP